MTRTFYRACIWLPLLVVGGRSESAMQRLMVRAPLIMVGVFVPAVLLVGLVVGQPVRFFGVALLGAITIIVLGYVYVGVVIVLERGRGAASDLFRERRG